MRRAAFLTLAEQGDFVIDDDLAHAPLARRGWQVESVAWNRPDVDWQRYDLVAIRSTWDYQHQADAFLATLAAIEASGARVENPLEIVRWNMRKTYLRDLAAQGVPVVPTIWRDGLGPGELDALFEAAHSEETVIKPVMSGNAQGAWRLDRASARAHAAEIEAYYANRTLMMQSFEPAIVSEGEFSLLYFNGEFSHGILKVPKQGDFRVQEEHGSEIRSITPEPALLAAGNAAIDAIGRKLLYARADLVRHGEEFRVMELELVEPALYLRMDPGAPERFAEAVVSLFA